MLTEEKVIASARTQYRAMFKAMAASRTPWDIHKGASGAVLLMRGAPMDVALPVLVKNAHAMSEQTMVNALSVAWRKESAPC